MISGVPCRSTVLSRPVAHLPGIKGRKSEVLEGENARGFNKYA